MFIILDILLTLANATESEELIKKMKLESPNYFQSSNPNTDVSKRLLEFLQEVVGEDSKLVKILKCCNQSTIAPAVIRLKSAASTHCPYKVRSQNSFTFQDVRAGWKIYISITRQDVHIFHKKWERSFEDESFQFRWEFGMIFDAGMDHLQSVSLKITELHFGPKDTEDKKQQFRNVMQEFLM